MNLVARLFDYLAPLTHSARDHRRENLEIANRNAARQLLRDERAYWQAQLYRAESPVKAKEAREQLAMLDEMEVGSHG